MKDETLVTVLFGSVAFIVSSGLGSHLLFQFCNRWNTATQSRKRLFIAAISTFTLYALYCVAILIVDFDDTHYSQFSIETCNFPFRVGGFFLWSKGSGLMFYCFRVYETYRGSPMAYNKRSIQSLLIIIAVFYVLEWSFTQFFGFYDFFSDKARREFGPFDQWQDCNDVYDEYGSKPKYLILAVQYVIGEVILSIVVMRLYVRKLIIMEQSFDFSDVVASKSAIPKKDISGMERLSKPTDGKMRISGLIVGLGEPSKTIEIDLQSGGATAEEVKSEPKPGATKEPIYTVTGFRRELLDLATLTSNLVVVTLISDFLILILVSIERWIGFVDIVVNAICIYLTFGFSRKIYDRICVCHNYCFKYCIVGLFQNCCRCGDECCDCNRCHTDVCCGEKKDIRSDAKKMTAYWSAGFVYSDTIEETNEE